MTDKPKLPDFKPQINNEYVVKFEYNQPLEREGQYGKFHIYQVTVWENREAYNTKSPGTLMSWIPGKKLHQGFTILKFGREDLIALKVDPEEGKDGKIYKKYTITDKNGKVHDVDAFSTTDPATQPTTFPDSAPETAPFPSDEDNLPFDNTAPAPPQPLGQPNNGDESKREVIFGVMNACLQRAYEMTQLLRGQDENLTFTGEDVQKVATSMFIGLTQSR